MFCIRILVFTAVSFLFNSSLIAMTHTLLSLHSNVHSLKYLSVITQDCKFLAESDVLLEGGNLVDQIYFSPKITSNEPTSLQFQMGTIANLVLIIDLIFQDNKCIIIKSATLNHQRYPLVSLTIEFESFLKLRSVSNIELELIAPDGNNFNKKLERYELEGFFPLYQFSLGGALNIGTSFRPNDRYRFKSGNPTIEPMPAFLVRYGPLFINNDGAGFVFLPFKNFLGLMTFLIEGEPVESDGFLPRKRSLYMGPLIVVGPLELHYYKDLRSINYGEVFKLTYNHKIKLTQRYSLQIRPFVQYWDSSYVNYYFGSSLQEKSFYQSNSTYNYGFGTQLNYDHHKWSYFTSFTIKRFGEEVRRAPLTTRGTDLRLILGSLVHFF